MPSGKAGPLWLGHSVTERQQLRQSRACHHATKSGTCRRSRPTPPGPGTVLPGVQLGQTRHALDGDIGAWNVSRVLRIPGAVSHKRDGAAVTLLEFHPERRAWACPPGMHSLVPSNGGRAGHPYGRTYGEDRCIFSWGRGRDRPYQPWSERPSFSRVATSPPPARARTVVGAGRARIVQGWAAAGSVFEGGIRQEEPVNPAQAYVGIDGAKEAAGCRSAAHQGSLVGQQRPAPRHRGNWWSA